MSRYRNPNEPEGVKVMRGILFALLFTGILGLLLFFGISAWIGAVS